MIRKRSGVYERASEGKLQARLSRLAGGFVRFGETVPSLGPIVVGGEVLGQMAREALAKLPSAALESGEMDRVLAQTLAASSVLVPELDDLAARVSVNRLHKDTPAKFSAAVQLCEASLDPAFVAFVAAHAETLDAMVASERDYGYGYFGLMTLIRQKYLLRAVPAGEQGSLGSAGGEVVERPQYLHMRVAVGLWMDLGVSGDWEARVRETYDLLSRGLYTHATPTMFNIGTRRPQLSSCFLVATEKDSIEGIYDTLKDCAMISKDAGGIGLHVSNVRAAGSLIKTTNCPSSGLVPMLRVFNETGRYVCQAGKRPGSIAIYLEPWHADVMDFLQLRRNRGGSEDRRCRDLFQALWLPDEFMRRVERDEYWPLFCPTQAPGLAEAHGEAFSSLLARYEAEGRAARVVKAQEVWNEIITSQIESGMPYLLSKEACQKSNQRHLGTIKSSNLCVAPETLLLTRDQGSVPIASLCDQAVHVWNGAEWAATAVHRTSEAAELLRVTLRDGRFLECTPYHEFPVTLANGGTIEQVPAEALRPGDAVTVVDTDGPVPRHRQTSVLCVERTGRVDATYCFTEPLRHMGVFNGILTFQCAEITEFTSAEETAVCNLASVALPRFVDAAGGGFDFENFERVVKAATRALDRVIDINAYPTAKAERSNRRHRPLGLGVQGLADVYQLLGMPFDSEAARALNRELFERMYAAALEASADLAEDMGCFASFAGSPASQGLLNFDAFVGSQMSLALPRERWAALRERVMRGGLRNSLLIALMPTASTAHILGNSECFEPYASNVFTRQTTAGDFVVVNRNLVRKLRELGLWDADMKTRLLVADGSVQGMADVPAQVRAVFKTAFELSMKAVIGQAADRQAFVCQSQSMNLFMKEPTLAKLTSMHFYSWRKGLKTMQYYLRSAAAVNPIKFTVERPIVRESQTEEPETDERAAAPMEAEILACSRANPEGCLMCGA